MSLFVIAAILLFIAGLVWYSFRHGRAFNRDLAQRPLQTPEEFASFYTTSAERAIALRLLPIYASFFSHRAAQTSSKRPSAGNR